MDYIKLVSGIGLLVVFTWLLFRNKDRKGIIHVLFRLDTVLGLIAGLYLIINSTISLLEQA